MRQTLLAICSLLLISCLGLVQAIAQVPVQATPTAVSNVNSSPATNLPMQRLGVDDLLTLAVYDAPEFSMSVRVGADGTIRIPMLRETLPVQGLLSSEVEKVIGEALKRNGLLVDPFVTVTVAEYHSRPVNVIGAVKTPTIFQAIGTVSVLDAIAKAGGVASDLAGPLVVVTRPDGTTGADAVQQIPLKTLMDGSDPKLNVKLTGGETVRIPEVAKIIVQGSVQHPGVFPVLDPISTNTVTNAIAQASGLAQFADHKAFIYRIDDQGVRHIIDVPLWEILQRKKPDMILQAKDTLYIPDSPKRRITQTAIQSLTGMSTSAATAAIYTTR